MTIMTDKLSSTASTLLALVILSTIYSCGSSGLPDNNAGVPATIGTGSGGVAATAANIGLTATPANITTGTTSSIKATVTTSAGGNVADGTVVSFTLSSSAMGTINSQATTSSGIASVTFTASTVPGTVTVTAKIGSLSQTAVIIISAPATGNIEFVSASPQKIGIKGSGQASTSTIKFLVKDINGNPAIDGTSVSFTMYGPGGGKLPAAGGEYIGDPDTTPTTASGSTVSGYASTTLNSGSVAGTVTITAAVASGSSASSSVISIGGGLPSASHFNLATTKVNLPGLVWSNKTADISAFLADRFGNFNVLKGTTVSFYTEAGAIDASNITDDTGITTVKFRTQAPMPAKVAATASEIAAISNLNTVYSPATPIPTDGSVHPRNGWTTILATVQGEEAFNDENGNGLYDPGETFTDLGEPFIDTNDNGTRDAGEIFIDINGNGTYDGPNGVWDGPGCTGTSCQNSKMIWVAIKLAFTGDPSYCEISPKTFAIGNGGSQTFKFMVGDMNTNRLVPGTTINVTTDNGSLAGDTSFTVPDGLPNGPAEITFILKDATPTTVAAPPDVATVTVTVTPAEGLAACPQAITTGTVQ